MKSHLKMDKPEILKYAIGCDISKDKFDVCASSIDREQRVVVLGTHKFLNTPSGIKEFIEWSKKKCKLPVKVSFVMEATGVYHENLALSLHQAGLSVSVVLPNNSNRYLKSIGFKSKNDKNDSVGLARMACEQNLTCWNAPNTVFIELRNTTRSREALIGFRTQISNQIHAASYSAFSSQEVLDIMNSTKEQLDGQIKKYETAIENILASEPETLRKVERICQVKGLGIVTMATLLAETLGFEQFNSIAQLVSYAGLDVVENQSGKSIGKTRISKKGNAHIRQALHMPAFTAVKYEPHLANLWNRVYDRTKIKMKAYVAVQRKLLCLVYTLWKNNQEYDPNFHINHPLNKTSENNQN